MADLSTENRDAPDKLVQVGEYLSSPQAAMLAAELDAEGIESRVVGQDLSAVLSYYGTAVGGARVLIDERHAARATEVLAGLQKREGETESFPSDFDFGDETPEWAANEPDAEKRTQLMKRAFNAAVISACVAFFFPLSFTLAVYAIYLIVDHELWREPGEQAWRLAIALPCLLTSLLAGLIVFSFILSVLRDPSPPDSHQRRLPEGQETTTPVKQETTINLLPG